MQPPDITLNRLENINTLILIDLQYAMSATRKDATSEAEASSWEAALAAIEIELWSRGHKPPPK